MSRNEFTFKSSEECKEYGRLGGIASGKAKRAKKETREKLELLLSLSMHNGKTSSIDTIKSLADIKGKNVTVEDAILVGLIQKAMSKDLDAIKFVFNLLDTKNPFKASAEDNRIIIEFADNGTTSGAADDLDRLTEDDGK